jgi:Raf kinase inhibitor-like YbhB/YbcL family protein
MAFELTSPEFQDGQPIPRKFSCDGLDISPRLAWKNAPAGTASFSLLVNDPDAPVGDWVHWLLFNIPSSVNQLPEGIHQDETMADGTRQGRNSWHMARYGGPCPPCGTHRYFFTLYALDRSLDVGAGADNRDVLRAMKGHTLAQSKLMGTYTRQK